MVSLIKVFDPAIIFATLVIAFFGSYAGITLYEQYRLCSKERKPKLLPPSFLRFFIAISIGGIAIWCMHFVAMAGMRFLTPDTHEIVNITYRVDLTVTSFIVVVILTYLGIHICSLDQIYMMDKVDVIDQYIEEIRTKTIREIRSIEHRRSILTKSLLNKPLPLLVGGILIAGGVCVMHYIGMSAMVFDGTIRWNYGIVISSVLIALVAATAALWILFRLLALFPNIELLRFISALIMAVAVNGMHYTGMAAGDFEYIPNKTKYSSTPTIGNTLALYIALISCVLFLWIIFLISLADLRTWYHEQLFFLRQTDRRAEYYKLNPDFAVRFLEDYCSLRDNTNVISEKSNSQSNISSKKRSFSQSTATTGAFLMASSNGHLMTSGKFIPNIKSPRSVEVIHANLQEEIPFKQTFEV